MLVDGLDLKLMKEVAFTIIQIANLQTMRSFNCFLFGALLLLGTVQCQETCGPNVCPADEECCNESCGICSPKNSGVCTQQYCGPSFPEACFPGTSTVDVLGKGPTNMKDVRVGDHVRTASGNFRQVYAFGHHSPDVPAKFLKMSTSEGQSLEVTGKHLVFVGGSDNLIPAEDIQIGDKLQTKAGPTLVVKIQEIEGVGMYAPFTTDGTLLVNDIAASSYVSVEDSESHPWLQFQTAYLSHTALAPFRVFCVATSSPHCQSYNEHGISTYPALLLRLFQCASQKTGWWVVIGSYFAVAAVAAAIEVAFSSLYGFLVFIFFPTTMYAAWARCRKDYRDGRYSFDIIVHV